MCAKLGLRIDKLRVQLPLLACLCNPGIRDRHWVRINEFAPGGMQLGPDTLLRDLFQSNILESLGR